MALWGNNDNVTSAGTVGLNYSTGVVTGSGTAFGNAGSAQVGDVIRFTKSGTYYGDAVIKSIASTTSLTIGSTAGLSGAAISGSDFTVSQLPKYTVLDSKYSEASSGTPNSRVYGVSKNEIETGTQFETGVGWVGITTYNDTHGNLRVKKEILVAMSGITTGNAPIYPTL
tara:strand:+ start:210 stop:719 length:510 start_codon:yes stop_codon:yes gene_type:complete